jgi:hypothetical protein
VHARSSKNTSTKLEPSRPPLSVDYYGTPSMPEEPRAAAVRFTQDRIVVELEDGRDLAIPLEYFVRLRDAPADQIRNVELVDDGRDLHWPDLDEDIHVVDLFYPPRLAREFR